MKKSLSFVLVLMICLFAGVIVSNAVGIKISKIDCGEATPDDDTNGETKSEVCKVMVTATDSGAFANDKTVTINVKFNQPTDSSKFTVTDTSGDLGGFIDGEKLNEDKSGGSFVYHFSSAQQLEKNKTYKMVEIKFTAKNDDGLDCGGKISFSNGGDSYTGEDERTTTDNPKTGVSIPVAIIGVGSVAGLVIYSTSSRKIKMHRI